MTQQFYAAFLAVSAALSLGSHATQARHATAPYPPVEPPSKGAKAAAWVGQTGIASYYGPAHQGRRAASGRIFDQEQLTAAHPWLPFGTRVRVTTPDTGRSVIVTITDRLYSDHRIVDLSLAAARQLGMLRRGIATVVLAPA